MKQLRTYFWNIMTSPELIPLWLYWPKHDDKSIIFSSKVIMLQVQTHLFVLQHQSSRVQGILSMDSHRSWQQSLALQAHKYFQTFISFMVFVFLFHFHSLSCTKPKQTKRIFKKDMDKHYSWRVLSSCHTGLIPLP